MVGSPIADFGGSVKGAAATRYDKLISHFRGFVLIAAIVLWLR